VPYPVATVHNAGIVKHNDRYIMLFRSHLLQRALHHRQGRQRGWFFIYGSSQTLSDTFNGHCFAEYEAFGVEDLRISPVEGTNTC
jgi:predicted GH43/DUF377 family glycosyl hydrolase